MPGLIDWEGRSLKTPWQAHLGDACLTVPRRCAVSFRGTIVEHRWIVLEEPWLDEELLLLAILAGLTWQALR